MRAAKIALAALLWATAPVAEAAPPSYCQFGESRPLLIPTRKYQSGPRLMVDVRRGWVVKTGAVGSVIQRTTDGGRTWQDRTLPVFASLAPDLGDGDVFPTAFGLSALGGRRLWVSFDGVVHGREVLVVEQTQDGGQHWRRAAFPGAAEAVNLQFLDTRHGFLLAEEGHGRKDFYATGDGGRTWTQGGSPNQGYLLDYSATGMTFRTARDGWISGSVRSDPPVPLLRTRDGGRSWQVQAVDLPDGDEDDYADTYNVRFHGANRRRGAFTARLHGNSTRAGRNVNYVTSDGGEHWRIADVKGGKRR